MGVIIFGQTPVLPRCGPVLPTGGRKVPATTRPGTPARPQGFTLIEILVVIAIISVLAALLLPALVASRKSARQTAALLNMKSCGQVMLTYTTDNKGLFLAPFRPIRRIEDIPKWAWANPYGQDLTYTWNMQSSEPTETTAAFSTLWYSYMADYRGGMRLVAEQLSPLDAAATTMLRDAQALGRQSASRLYGSSFLYPPAFYVKPECTGLEIDGEGKLRGATVDTVQQPAGKVMLWEWLDSSGKLPKMWVEPEARVNVMAADGGVRQVHIADVAAKIAAPGSGVSPPLRVAMTFFTSAITMDPNNSAPLPGLTDFDHEQRPGYFMFTGGGINSRDIP